MAAICIYFQVHQPYRIKRYRVFDVGQNHDYFNDESSTDLNNQLVLERVIQKCYLPANKLLLKLLKDYPDLHISFSITGILLEQLEENYPLALQSFRDLVDTGRVEILSETYHHSLAFLYSQAEFEHQVELQNNNIFRLFGQRPAVFRNTELIYNNDLATKIEQLGFKGIITEGSDSVLDGQSPNYLYTATGTNLKMLLKNYQLSDNIAFRFAQPTNSGQSLTAHAFAKQVAKLNGEAEIINLFMDYETFGEHHWEATGIFKFLNELPEALLHKYQNHFVTPSQALASLKPVAELDIPHFISWADVDRDLSAWLSNSMQHEALQKLYAFEEQVLASKDPQLIADWRRLQTSDHFYYMCTKWFADGDVHKYFSPYESPYEAFIAFMNVLQDIKLRLGEHFPDSQQLEQSEQLIEMEAKLI